MQKTIEHDPVLAAIALNGRSPRPEQGERRQGLEKHGVRERQTLDDRGVSIPEELRLALRNARITTFRTVNIVRQTQAAGSVVRGTESGGAVADLGHYVTFAAEDGSALEWLHPQDAIAPNQTHAVVIAASFVRVEAVRLQRNYNVAITRHSIKVTDGKAALVSTMLFRGHGFLGLELWDRDKAFRGAVLPAFYTRGGEPIPVRAIWEPALKAAIEGACCIGCRDSHYLRAQRNTATGGAS
ncbi:MAG: hypothetical protein M3Y27_31260 [Acidobacteriota bacterium]|nr:hypothetical protein [Acidobacteriota bacterium]